ncbi:MAG: RICIN domain-containing protein [Clostridia bacterium]
MKKCLSIILALALSLSVCMALPISAQEADLKNTICTIENVNGYLIPSGNERGNALTVGEEDGTWRLKAFLGGSYAFIGEGDLAADVNGASKAEGVTIIQWTSTGANNQRWMIEEAEDGYYYIKSVFSDLYMTESEGVITQEVKDEEKNQLWKIDVVDKYEPVVEKMLESDAAKSLSEYRYGRLCDFLLSSGEFNLLTYDKVEKMIDERDYFNLSYDEQVAFVEECFTVEPTSLMYGSMATKLKRDIKVEYVGIEENIWQSWHGIPEEEARRYDVTITDTENGDSHVFLYYSPYDNDEEYAAVVGEAVACFEMPVAKSLWRFIYTSMNTASWNGGDGTIWNNTGYRGDVNNMVQMFAHELGHVMDNGRQDNDVWYRAIAQDMVPVTGYGKTNRWEDLAEFSRLYLLAKGDESRIEAIENTYPARTVAYKALLYAVDSEFYDEYKDEYEKIEQATGDYDKSVCVTFSRDGKYMRDVDGKIIFTDMSSAASDWYTWEIYSRKAGSSIVRNKATGRYLTLDNSILTLGDGTSIGLKSGDEGYKIVESATGFTINEDMTASLSGDLILEVDEVEEIFYRGDYKIVLEVTKEELGFEEGVGITLSNDGDLWNFVPVDKNLFLIKHKETGKVFDISGNSVEKGASAILYSVTGGTNQHFMLENNGDSTYTLKVRHSGLSLTKSKDGFCQGDESMGYVRWKLVKAE